MKCTEEIHNKLRELYNPEGSNRRLAQLRMLDLLLYVDRVCKKHDIPYCLEAGTLLGAVRHGGFIPWDDDVDVIFPEEYTNKLKEAFKKEKHPTYVLQDEESDPLYFKNWYVARDTHSKYNHSSPEMVAYESLKKYQGIQVDLFPISRNVWTKLNKIKFGVAQNYSRKLLLSCGVTPLTILIARLLFSIQKGTIAFCKLITPKQRKWAKSYGIGEIEEFDEDVLFPFSEVEFEGHKFPAPHNPHAFLTIMYGDYMQIPDDSLKDHHKLSDISLW